MTDPRIAGIGTAVPPHVVSQQQVRAVVEALFADQLAGLERLLGVFDHSHVQQRHFIKPPEWYAQERGWEEINAAYTTAAVDLSLAAARQALDNADTSASDLSGIVIASTTGIMTPSLDAIVMQRLGMGLSSIRIPIFGLGCAGGVSGLARAADLFRSGSGGPILFIAVEICSATFQRNDVSKSNVIGSSLFADGAAAVVLSADGTGPAVLQGHSTLFAGTEDVMGWDVSDTGLNVRFSRSIPSFINDHLPDVLNAACLNWGITQAQIKAFVTHPGGQKVLDAFCDAVGRTPESMATSYAVLRDHGNMSSASVLFVLDRMMQQKELEGGFSVMSALGPGFSSENLLLRQP